MSASGARPGQTVRTDDRARWLLLDRAAPSGWWAVPVGGGDPVRLVYTRGAWVVKR